ncbi:GNAT family N-acetyltransferase [Variovorax sp. LjRoot130]|uniref:GNAT family N-acetyltransferase n=1 Tax=Variovorax sp. LjRoot130 TaxID=3342261 RepID=UPI003ECC4167
MTREIPELQTPRLRLRAWRDEDLPLFAELNADEQVNQYLLGPLTRTQSDALVGRITEHFLREGFGFWAVEAPGVASFIGMVGIAIPSYTAPFAPCVEVGWRLGCQYWGQGFATKAARAALEFGFESVGLSEIVALTVPGNARSRAVMSKLGMTRTASDDFEHPLVPAGHQLTRHVLYRLSKEAWLRTRGRAEEFERTAARTGP